MKTVNKYKTLALAYDSFTKAQYDEALQHYASVLKDFPNSKEAYNGAILAEMAMSGEAGAEALFDYYEVLRENNAEEADVIIGEILETMDGSIEELTELFKAPSNEQVEYEDGIMYSDFKLLVEQKGDFKQVFENVMFSTRVIITEKADFVDFLSKLVEHGYDEMALSYLESALSIYPGDNKLRALVEKIDEGRPVEN